MLHTILVPRQKAGAGEQTRLNSLLIDFADILYHDPAHFNTNKSSRGSCKVEDN